MSGDGLPPRNQSYSLNGKHSYLEAGDKFKAEVSILAGAPAHLADLSVFKNRLYDPLRHLASASPADRYSAVKALPYREELQSQSVPALENLLRNEQEERIAL
jgi:hypothetical protein